MPKRPKNAEARASSKVEWDKVYFSAKKSSSTQDPTTLYRLAKPKWYTTNSNAISKNQKKSIAQLSSMFTWTPAQFLQKIPTPPFPTSIFEMGYGTGTNLLSLATSNPQTQFYGAEIHKASYAQALQATHDLSLKNVTFVPGDAVKFLKNNTPESTFDQILILFPDPWEADGTLSRQHKPEFGEKNGEVDLEKGDRRIVCGEVIEQCFVKLKSGGKLVIVTDVERYADHVLEVMGGGECGRSWFGGGELKKGSRSEYRSKEMTKYEKRAVEELGHQVREFEYVKLQPSEQTQPEPQQKKKKVEQPNKKGEEDIQAMKAALKIERKEQRAQARVDEEDRKKSAVYKKNYKGKGK